MPGEGFEVLNGSGLATSHATWKRVTWPRDFEELGERNKTTQGQCVLASPFGGASRAAWAVLVPDRTNSGASPAVSLNGERHPNVSTHTIDRENDRGEW